MGEEGRFLVKEWLDGCVFFDRQFGDTHALDPVAAAILMAMDRGEFDRSAWSAKMYLFYPESTPLEIESRVSDSIEHLKRLGLVKADIN